MSTLRKLIASEVEFTFEWHPEHGSPEGLFGYETEAENRKAIDRINRQWASGNQFAWFAAVVRATWTAPNGKTYTGVDSLGYCSYKNERDFRKHCFPDMCSEALSHLNDELADLVETAEQLRTYLKP